MNQKAIENIGKGLLALGIAIFGWNIGKIFSDNKHKPIYDKQKKQAKILNEISKKKYY